MFLQPCPVFFINNRKKKIIIIPAEPDPPLENLDMPVVGDVKSTVSLTQNQLGWYRFGTNIDFDTKPVAYQNAYDLFNVGMYAVPAAGAVLTLPDASGTSLIEDNSTVIGIPTGTNDKTLLQAHLPNVNLPLRHPTAVRIEGQTNPPTNNWGGIGGNNYFNTETFYVSLNPGTQTTLDVKGKYLPVRHMVYLDVEV